MSEKRPTKEELEGRRRWFEDYCRRLENESTVIAPQDGITHPCPCCFCLTLDGRAQFEICSVCFWEDDGQDERDASSVRGGPNGAVSLEGARQNYAKFGACEERHIVNVRPPKPDELPGAPPHQHLADTVRELATQTMKLPEHIATRIVETIAGLPPEEPYHIDWEARQHGAIALMGTIGSTWLLRPDGTFLDVDSDLGKPLQPLPADLHITAIVAGCERYPWLSELLPAKPASAVNCPQCLGKGQIYPAGAREQDHGIFCPLCHALGWIESTARGT